MANHRTLKALIPAAAGLLCVALLNVPSAQAAPRDKQVGTTTGANSAGAATAARAQSTSPSPKATTAISGRPQTLVFKPGRYNIKN